MKHTPTAPPKYVATPCPHCSQPIRTVNGGYLRHLRERAGLDQRAFGKRIKRSGPYVSDIERNRRACSEEMLASYLALNRRNGRFHP